MLAPLAPAAAAAAASGAAAALPLPLRIGSTGGLLGTDDDALGVVPLGDPNDPYLLEHPCMRADPADPLPSFQAILQGKHVMQVGPARQAKAGSASGSVTPALGRFDNEQAQHLLWACPPKGGSSGSGDCKRKRCALTRGDWCKAFETQEPASWQAAPRGSRDCPSTKWGVCNRVGSCHHDFGTCLCPAGWQGVDCSQRQLRPCTHRHREQNKDGGSLEPMSHMGPDGRDLDWSEEGWTASRCIGVCDEELGVCYCPGPGPLGHVPAPRDAPPGTPPLQTGRYLGDICKPNRDPKTGAKLHWGHVDPDEILDPVTGWCSNATKPRAMCGCVLDGWHGEFCTERSEAFCLNQCSGHGDCQLGFCKCDEGWYGYDCSRKRAGLGLEPGRLEQPPTSAWLGRVAAPLPAAQEAPPAPRRRRPLIYIYDMPPEFTTRLLQYRIWKMSCTWRIFERHNVSSVLSSNVYALETYLMEAISASSHRTFDPEEADYFFVPLFLTCYFWPVMGWADHPWFGAPYAIGRAYQGTNMFLQAKRWLEQAHPWWNRRGGRDHIWLSVNDEGACIMPTEIYNTSIVLTHWGRMDERHVSGTAWGYDNYTAPLKPWPPFLEGDWRDVIRGHRCYTPGKDLVVPQFKPPDHYHASPLLGAPPLERDILLYMRGDTGTYRNPCYSRGIRQKLAKLAFKHGWAAKHRIFLGTSEQLPGHYSEHLARSVFCVVAPGDGWSGRAEDAILHGCIPLVIMDGVHAVFESVLEWDAFAVRIREAAVDKDLPKFLLSFSPEQIERMQRRLAVVWHRFAYFQLPLVHDQAENHIRINRKKWAGPNAGMTPEQLAAKREQGEKFPEPRGAPPGHPYQPVTKLPLRNDAFHTIMQWLYWKIPDTR